MAAPLSINTRPPNGRTRSRIPAMPIRPRRRRRGRRSRVRHPPPRAARGRRRSALPRRRVRHARVERRCSATPASREERSRRRPAASGGNSAIAHVAGTPFDSLHCATIRSIAAASVVSTSCGGRNAHTRRRISPRLALDTSCAFARWGRAPRITSSSARAVANDSSIGLEMLDHAREALRERVVNVSRQSLPLVLRSRLVRPLGQVVLRLVELAQQPRANRRVAIGAVDIQHHRAERDAGCQEVSNVRDRRGRLRVSCRSPRSLTV